MPKIKNSEYIAIHVWLSKNFPLPKKCSNRKCPRVSSKFVWALIHGKEYERNRSNFKVLCDPCHRKYDYKYRERQKEKGSYSPLETGRKHLNVDLETYNKLRKIAFKKEMPMGKLIALLIENI